MQHKEYWAKRFEKLTDAQLNKGAEYYYNLQEQYRQAIANIEKDIAKWYTRYATENGITLTEAKRLLNGRELAEFRMDVKEYIKKGESLDPKWAKQLEAASVKVHVSRLEALKVQMQQQAEMLYSYERDGVDELVRKVYTDGYYHTAYEIQKGIGVGFDLMQLDTNKIDKLISKPWAADGKNFSERIWNNRAQLVSELENRLTQSIIRGQSPKKVIAELAERFNVNKSRAGALVMTESAFFASASQRDAFNDLDVEKYEILATLDSRTSETCRVMDGEVIPMSEYKPGVTAPPFHVRCRSTTVPFFDDEFSALDKRAARGEDGKYYTVPASMKYKDWEEAFIKGGDKAGLPPIKILTNNGKSNIIKINSTQYVPVATIEEADNFLKILGIDGGYKKGHINIDVANAVNKAVVDARGIFGNNLQLRSIGKYPKAQADFVAAYSPVFGDVYLYKCGAKDTMKRMAKTALENFSCGSWSTGSAEHFIRHELGHALHIGVGKKIRRAELEKIFNETRANIRWGKYGYTLNEYIKAGLRGADYIADLRAAGDILSAYGLTTVDEMVAEAVAEYMNGAPRDLAVKVVNTLMGW